MKIENVETVPGRNKSAVIDGIKFEKILCAGNISEQLSTLTIGNNPWNTGNTEDSNFTPIVNAVDIFWNDAILNDDIKISSTSDLLKVIQNLTNGDLSAIDADRLANIENEIYKYQETFSNVLSKKYAEQYFQSKESYENDYAKLKSTLDSIKGSLGDFDNEDIKSQIKDIYEQLNQKAEVMQYAVMTDIGDGRYSLSLKNYDSISGLTTDGRGVNLVMVSKWDVADFGSTQVHINLNGSNDHPTYNDTENIVLEKDLKEYAKTSDISELQPKGDYPEYLTFNETRKTIQLENYDSISGKTTTGGGVNLAMVSKWDVADFGSTQVHINLNGSNDHPTYNNDEQIALVSDLDNLATKEDVKTAIDNLVNGADETMDTLSELATVINENKDVITSLQEAGLNKATKEELSVAIDGLSEVYQPKGEYVTFDTLVGYQPKGDYITSDKFEDFVTTDQLEEFVTSEALEEYAKTSDLEEYAKVESLDQYVTSDKLEDYATVVQLEGYQPKGEYVTTEQIEGLAKSEDLNQFQTKGDYVEYTQYVEGRKTLQLENYDSISGKLTNGGGANIAMISKWDVADFGSTQCHINLNGSKDHPTYNDTKEIALVSDIKSYTYDKETIDKKIVDVQCGAAGIDASMLNDIMTRLQILEAASTTHEYVYDADAINSIESPETKNIVVTSTDAMNSLNKGTEYKSLTVVGGNISENVKLVASTNINIEGTEISGPNNGNDAKVSITAPEVTIKNVNINPGSTIYNVFNQTLTSKIDKFTATNVNVDCVDLTHNVFNIYAPENNAEIVIKDSSFNIDLETTNVLRISNLLNSTNVTVTFENVDWTYENGSGLDNDQNFKYAGLVIYQACKTNTLTDLALNGYTSAIETWKFVFKNCRYNGDLITYNNVNEISQVIYFYGIKDKTTVDFNEGCGIIFE